MPIRFDPTLAVVHAHRVDLGYLLRRRVSYAQRFIENRRASPDLPGSWLVRLGVAGAPLLAVARLACDVRRLPGARDTFGCGLGMQCLLALAAAACRLADAFTMGSEILRCRSRRTSAAQAS